MHLCSEVHSLEWSGVLFYTTEGEFGKDGFKCIGKELYLMDIGTSGHTEYTFGSDFVKLLMDRPDLRAMSKGHIHSHNNMSVFFSPTDEGELYGNCDKHNLYLSLIVNNRNQMCARIAFQAVQKSIKLEYKNSRGVPQEETIEHVSEDPVIFEYECKIILPGGLDMSEISLRIQEVRAANFGKNNTSRGGVTGFHEKAYESWKLEERKAGTTEARVYDFVIKLISLDPQATGSLNKILRRIQESGLDNGQRFSKHLESMGDRLYEFYGRRFPDDRERNLLRDRLDQAITVVEGASEGCPELAEKLKRFFQDEMRYTYNSNDSESRDYGEYRGYP